MHALGVLTFVCPYTMCVTVYVFVHVPVCLHVPVCACAHLCNTGVLLKSVCVCHYVCICITVHFSCVCVCVCVCVLGLHDSAIVIHCHDTQLVNYYDDDSTFCYNGSSRHTFSMNFYRSQGLLLANQCLVYLYIVILTTYFKLLAH